MKFKSEHRFSTFRAVHHQSLSIPQPYLLPQDAPNKSISLHQVSRCCPIVLHMLFMQKHSSLSFSLILLNLVLELEQNSYFCLPSRALTITGIRGKDWERERILFFPISLYFCQHLEDFFNLEGATSWFQLQ